MTLDVPSTITSLNRTIVACTLCPRLRAYCGRVARDKKREFRDWQYWGKPVPGFGDPGARLLVVGLAPAAHGANRTGRMFTGDSSGSWLYEVLHRHGFANQPQSLSRDDGLRLTDCYIAAAARCAPPGNKPSRLELDRCRPYLAAELRLLRRVRVRSEEHTSELQSPCNLVCRLLLEKKKKNKIVVIIVTSN